MLTVLISKVFWSAFLYKTVLKGFDLICKNICRYLWNSRADEMQINLLWERMLSDQHCESHPLPPLSLKHFRSPLTLKYVWQSFFWSMKYISSHSLYLKYIWSMLQNSSLYLHCLWNFHDQLKKNRNLIWNSFSLKYISMLQKSPATFDASEIHTINWLTYITSFICAYCGHLNRDVVTYMSVGQHSLMRDLIWWSS